MGYIQVVKVKKLIVFSILIARTGFEYTRQMQKYAFNTIDIYFF